ncbi:MAG: hypothetical protein U5K99_00805 [Anaerolineales bacterium]|nr:hypothetical protein [Anaerolineales bacterium]
MDNISKHVILLEVIVLSILFLGEGKLIMETIKIVLANKSCLLRDLLKRSINKIEGLQIVGETKNIEDLNRLVEGKQAEWAIVTLAEDDKVPESFDSLLSRKQDLSLMAMKDSGERIKIRRMEIQEESYQKFSLADLGELLLDQVNTSSHRPRND